MEDLTIKVQDEQTKSIVTMFFDNYKDPIRHFINSVVKGEGGAADAAVMKDEDGTIKIYKITPDRGWVLGETDGVLVLKQYSEVATGDRYVITDGDKLGLFIKQLTDEPDLKVGAFIHLNDAVNDLGSEAVKRATDQVLDRKKEEEKATAKLERKAKLKALSQNATEVEAKQD